MENETYAVETATPLSEVTGPGLLTRDVVDTPPRDDEQGLGDTFDWTKRLVDWSALTHPGPDGISFGPAAPASYIYSHLIQDMLKWQMHKLVSVRYYGFSYKAIKIRVTLSNPKNLVGGAAVGWFPYVDYYDESPVGTVDVWMADVKSQYALINSTDSQLLLYGSAQDIQLTIPWTFKFPMFTMDWQRKLSETSQETRPPHGSPILYVTQLAGGPTAVSDLATNAYLRIYAEFEDLKYYGPQNAFVSQSGAGATMAAAAVGAAAETGLSYFASKIAEASGAEEYSTPKTGNFDNPQAVQMSYFGDTTSIEYPQTRPIFKNGLPPPSVATLPSIHEFLAKPFLIGTSKTSADYQPIQVNPTKTLGLPSSCNYMSYFAMLSRYWRGGINFHFVVAGHPLVETELTIFADYDDRKGYANSTFDDAATHRTIRSGAYSLDTHFPYLNTRDYMDVVDPCAPNEETTYSVGTLYFRLRVVGTMLDIEPDIPVFIFASAAEDFKFYQPYPPGFYNTRELEEVNDLSVSQFVSQVGLPFRDEKEVADLRGVSIPDPKIIVPVESLTDLMKIWSRALPFSDYDNSGDEEPILDAKVGFQSPAWFPPVDRARDYTGDNSWYVTADYVSMISILFLYWRGTMGFKVIASVLTETDGYMYVSLAGVNGDSGRSQVHTPFTQAENDLPDHANFATGTVATATRLQPVLEASIPYRGTNVWSNVIWNSYGRGVTTGTDPQPLGVRTNVQLFASQAQKLLGDSMYRKIDDDFALCVPSTLPPPAFWLARGFSVTD